ncbi:TRF2-interacting telomeric protein/Rap1 C terminal domain-containing protein [Xylaria palmicola]|nr:TRF2-interacting telomeric protein/Rap1 C terminal domain-containing protein [Xylaria palmicola]
MSAPGITYSGALAKKHAQEDASIKPLKGLKFWLSARIPQRRTCVDSIHENGGTVVAKEENADILLCDPAKEPAPESYSYELIAHAVEEGCLNPDTKEAYLCSSLASDRGLPEPARKSKLTRTKFTAADDQLLTKYVTEMESEGKYAGGNSIYKELAQQHPHHTWHSWRDRWVKKLHNAPRPPVSTKAEPPQPNGPPSASGQKEHPVTGTRTRFTAEEDDILLETIHAAIENHEPWNGFQPYKRLASEFPQRTFTAWRERAVNHVAKQNKDLIVQWEFEAGFHPGDKEDPPQGNVEDQQTPMVKDKTTKSLLTDQTAEAAKGVAESELPEKDAAPMTVDSVSDKSASSPYVHRSRSPEQFASAMLPANSNAAVHPASSPVLEIPQSEPNTVPITTKEQFIRDYNTFLESRGGTERRIPTVMGRAISLWELWQSVRSQKVETAEVDWRQVAEDLELDWNSTALIPQDLQQCYGEHLAPFAEAMMSFNDSSDEEDSTEDNADAETETPLPSSPPVLSSLKRRLSATSPAYKRLHQQTTPKRRKLDRNQVIPSTPEPHAGTARLRPRAFPDRTPTASSPVDYRNARSTPQTQTSSNAKNRDTDKMKDGLGSLPVQQQGRKITVEPETQDFRFDTQDYTHGTPSGQPDTDSENEATPSQQLLLEDATSQRTQHSAPVLTATRQRIVQTTPTPHRRIRVPIQSDDSADDDMQQSNKRSRTSPTPLSAQQARPKRRALTSSWKSNPSASAGPVDLQNSQTTTAIVRGTEPRQRATPLKETPDDIIDRFVSLGYTRDTVLRSLRATSWIIGNAGQVMEMLKRGEPLPPRTTGVWTDHDDESLTLVYSDKTSADAKAEKRRMKAMKRLQAKHGAEQIALRRRYLLDELPE